MEEKNKFLIDFKFMPDQNITNQLYHFQDNIFNPNSNDLNETLEEENSNR